MNDLTPRQKQVLAFIKSYLKSEGIPPTRQEISNHFGWKYGNAAQCHLILMANKKAIRLIPGTSRGIVIL